MSAHKPADEPRLVTGPTTPPDRPYQARTEQAEEATMDEEAEEDLDHETDPQMETDMEMTVDYF